jgi:Plavaka transposase
MPPTYPRCPYCSKALPTQNAVRLHVSSSLQCSEAWKKQFNQNPPKRCQRLPLKPSFQCDGPDTPSDDEMETIADNIHLPLSCEAPIDPLYHRPASPTPPARAARGVNEEIRGVRYSLPYPRSIANPISLKKTRFEVQKDCYTKAGASPWHPFLNQDDWELARWLLNNVNQKATEKYLKLPMVSDTVKKYPTRYNEMQVQNNKDITFKSNYHLMKAVDKLSTGPGWTCEIIDVAGDKEGEEGGTLFEDLELWRRDPVECVNELIGNPAFKDYISYVPEWVYTDDTAQERIYDEMWTSDWWWKTQVSQ